GAPIQSQEVWAAGVTYKRSLEARADEAVSSDPYDLVYSAPRPELFFKATAGRVRGPGEAVFVRSDSTWDVPEPELAVLCNSRLELVDSLGRDQRFDSGCVLLTGTGIVPPSDFSLQQDDVVAIRIDGIGELRNPVLRHRAR